MSDIKCVPICRYRQIDREKKQQQKEELAKKDEEHKKQMEAKDKFVNVHNRRVVHLEGKSRLSFGFHRSLDNADILQLCIYTYYIGC